jgi:hypothetical protein
MALLQINIGTVANDGTGAPLRTAMATVNTNSLTIDSFIAQKGAANGLATLDAGGKIPSSQLPSTVMEYRGMWDASTNTPTLADGMGDSGDVYIVSVGGTVNLGSGNITFLAGDWVIYNGSIWEKSDDSDSVKAGSSPTFGQVTLTEATLAPLIVSSEAEVTLLTSARATRLLNNNFTDFTGNPLIAGLHSFITTTGATNTPSGITSVTGAGIRIARLANADSLSDWIIWRNGGAIGQSQLWFQYKTATATWAPAIQMFHQANANLSTIDWTAKDVTASQYKLSALNTAPTSATDTGTTGEIRITSDYIYVCVATNTWKRTLLETW